MNKKGFDNAEISLDTIENMEEDELSELKAWLFRENIRVESEKRSLEVRQKKFSEDRARLDSEIKAFRQKVEMDKKRTRDNEQFFDKKMDILRSAYAQLESDKNNIERERMRLEAERQSTRAATTAGTDVSMFFQGVNSLLALKKRYKDLIKIFHPDNICGDTQLLQMINEEYNRLNEIFIWQKKA